jgi:zinc protease
MTDIVMNPAFAPEEIARLKQQALSNLTASMQDPDFLADSVFQRAVYGIHPYGRPSDGTLRSIPAIQREDIVKFQQAHYAPNGSALVIAGDLSTDQAFKLAEQWLGSWQRKEMPKLDLNRIPKLEQRRIVAVNKPDSVQTEIRVGHPTVPRNDPDYFKVLVANYVLGGSPSGRLNQKLRAEKGLTYGAYTMIVPRKGPGSFHSITETRTEKTTEALELIFDEIRKMRSNPVPTDELRNAKDFLIGSFPLSIEVPNDLASRLTTVFLYNLGDDYLKTYRDRIAAVSADDVLQAAKEKISAENTVVVLVGKIDEFKSQLQALGKVQIIPLDKLDLGSPTLN